MLVVDDDADTRELAVLGLERAGAEVVAVGTFARAKDTLERMRFDAIVSGQADDIPEQAFMYVGGLDAARAKAAKLK